LKKRVWAKDAKRYTKAKLLSDVFQTLQCAGIALRGKLVAEVLEVAFCSLQAAVLQRGAVQLPHLGLLTIELRPDDKFHFHFMPCQSMARMMRAAMVEEE
jgi:hypothetical protein